MRFLSAAFFFLSLYAFSQEIGHRHSVQQAFIENKGQWNENILFKSRFPGGNLWVQQHKLLFHLADYSNIQKIHANPDVKDGSLEYRQDVLHLNFVGSNTIKSIQKDMAVGPYYNYFLGNDTSRWVGDVHAYSEATLKELYNGIDLRLIEENGSLKYEFHVSPDVDPAQIRIEYAGQQNIRIDKKGNLLVTTKNGIISENKPYAYQIINGKIVPVSCEFVLTENRLGFKLKNYNKLFKLIIDPVLIFATYCGSVTDNFGMTATYGHDGTAYSAGTIYGNAYPTPDDQAYDINSNFTVPNVAGSITTDAFISKYSADGTTMLWTTFLGGGDDTQGTETVHSLICDKLDNVYVYGVTSSTDFPIQGGYQNTHGGGQPLSIQFNGSNFGITGTDIYLARISANGHNLLASTYLGGSDNDGVNYTIFGKNGSYSSVIYYDSLTTNYGDQFRGEIMLDSLNNCLVASCSRSTDFPTANAFQAANAGEQDGVIFKLSPNLSSLLFSTYIGGSNNDACYSVKIDSSYNIVFAGGTSSNNLPQTAGSFQAAYNGGIADGFVGKLNMAGNALQRISYIGTGNYDQVFFVEIDRNDNVFLLGQSRGGTFPVLNAGFVNPNSGQFIAKLDPSLTVLENSTVFGNGNGNINISPSAFLVDICGNIYVSGWGANILQGTPLNNMQVTADALQSTPPNGFDFYLMVIERSFNSLMYATYLGGSAAREHVDGGTSRYDKNGVVYQSVCGGCQGNSDFPTTPGAWSSANLSSNCNNLIFKFDFELVLNAEFTASQTTGCAPLSVTFVNETVSSDTYFWVFGNGDTSSVIFSPTILFDSVGVYQVFLISQDSVCLLVDTAQTTIIVGAPLQLSVSNDTTLCAPDFLELTANSFGTSSTFHWSSNSSFTDTLNLSMQDSTVIVNPILQTQTYYARVSNPGCAAIDSVVVNLTSSGLLLTGSGPVCQGEDFFVNAINNSSLTYTYTWRPDSLIKTQLSPSSISAVTNQPNYLFVDVAASNGCSFTDSILIAVSPVNSLLINAIASDTVILSGADITLTALPAGNFTYQWSPVNGVADPAAQQTTATVDESTTFTVQVTDGVCTATDSVSVLCVTPECKPPYVYVPNAFSPNEKGKNEIFYVRGPQIETMLLRVYNRWGELVFESTDPQVGWDGTYKTRKLDPDVFDYYLEVTCIGGNSEIIKGNITILK
ncbi:MAG: gliding motility-associated C-terminal domain-containing protein [Bacteroidota bacterium]